MGRSPSAATTSSSVAICEKTVPNLVMAKRSSSRLLML
jgi:hypothetical protein